MGTKELDKGAFHAFSICSFGIWLDTLLFLVIRWVA